MVKQYSLNRLRSNKISYEWGKFLIMDRVPNMKVKSNLKQTGILFKSNHETLDIEEVFAKEKE